MRVRVQADGHHAKPLEAVLEGPASPGGLLAELSSLGVLELGWHDASPAGVVVKISVQAFGERPQLQRLLWQRDGDGSSLIGDGRETPDVGREFFRRLETMASMDLERAFLFELDKQTLEPYMSYAGVPESVRQRRTCQQERLIPTLIHQLGDSHDKVNGTYTPEKESLWTFADIFWRAAEKRFVKPVQLSLEERITALGDTLERFAAGSLRATVDGEDGVETALFEPDSFYVFLFAELAYSAAEQGVYTKEFDLLLPRLVRMQELFGRRMNKKGTRFDSVIEYGEQPELVLTASELEGLRTEKELGDEEYRTDEGQFRAQVNQNLSVLADSFGDPVSPGPSCRPT